MAPITPSTRTTTYNPVTPTMAFPVNFPIADNADLKVTVNGAPRTDFTVAATYSDGLSYDAVVNMNSAVTGAVIILGSRTPRRQNQFQTGRGLTMPDLNAALNAQEIEIQEARRDDDRAIKMPPGYAGLTLDPSIPDGATLMRDGDKLVKGPNLPDLAASLIADATAQANRAHDEADRAEDARDIAAGYASDAVSQGNVPIYSTVVGMPALAIPAGIQIIRVNGYYASKDGGGAKYARVDVQPAHGLKIRTADRFLPSGVVDLVNGGWWEIVAKGIINARCAGCIPDSDGTTGNGTDNTAAIQRAIDFVAPFVWKGTTRDTELKGSSAGVVIMPTGISRCAGKLRLAPNLTIRGEVGGNDFTVRTGLGGTSSGLDRMGSTLFMDIADFTKYAIDTSPYDASGNRLDDTTLTGSDSFNGVKTEVHNIRLDDMTIYGNWSCKGINLAGGVKSELGSGLLIRGFTVGVRYSATWYGKCRARILASWRGIISYYSVTHLDVSGASVWRSVEAPVYDPSVSGYDGTEPAVDSWWTAAVNKRSAGLYSFYGNTSGSFFANEGFDYAFMSWNAVNDLRDIYTEASKVGIIISSGPDQQNERYHFKSIFSATCPLIFSRNARLSVDVAKHNYSAGGYGALIGDVFNTLGYEGVPVINGVRLKDGVDVFNDQSIAYGGLRQYQGPWTPTLTFGGANADSGSGVRKGRWVRIGNLVFVTFQITVPTKSAATGSAQITGLPFRIRNDFGQDPGGRFSFRFAAPDVSLWLQAGGYALVVSAIDTDFSNGADIRGSVTYETDEIGPWGW